ncbi:MAG: cob(I)yrinic acid a,c-diamide adenosyltransferase [Chthonomonas sp.]|nr:cob(I)yrinic acid a,c-diamide adenosyltransferase [Chthonomonas sp.]
MKIYTRTGDDGTTGLLGNERRAKTDPIFDAIGAVDVLNAHLGLAASIATEELHKQLQEIQSRLFDLGAELAQIGATPRTIVSVQEADVAILESQIDAATAELAPLRNFILPGGTELAARLHVARTVCRRAERAALAHENRPELLRFLNRLSDWLFVMARLANHRADRPDHIWQPRT